MKKLILGLALMLPVLSSSGQNSQTLGLQEDYFKVVDGLIDYSVPVVSVQELHSGIDSVVVLDAREPAEFDVSHIGGAQFVGYNKFSLDAVDHLPRDTAIVVYCSVGYRSEKVAEQLQNAGFSNVSNLFGGVFEWVNDGYSVEDKHGQTNELHSYSKSWGKWIHNPEIEKRTKRK